MDLALAAAGLVIGIYGLDTLRADREPCLASLVDAEDRIAVGQILGVLWRQMWPFFVVAVVEELLRGAYHINHPRELVYIDLPHQALTIGFRPEGLRPVADIAEIYESENPAKLGRVKEKSISTERMEIHALIVRLSDKNVKGVGATVLTPEPISRRTP